MQYQYECAVSVCENGGDCETNEGGYTCTWTDTGYTGTNCDQGRSIFYHLLNKIVVYYCFYQMVLFCVLFSYSDCRFSFGSIDLLINLIELL